MRKAVVAIVSLVLSVALAHESGAQGLSKEMLMGRWCTAAGSYFFEPDKFTVTTNAGRTFVLPIVSIEIKDATILVTWTPDSSVATDPKLGKTRTTTFGEFSGGNMAQPAGTSRDGSESPRREFHRC